MDLRQLEYFIELCRTRNFTKASQKLCVSQPSITKSIQRLEEELGTDLFDRSIKPLGITEAGELFYRRVSVIVEELNDAKREVEALSSAEQEIVTIGIAPWSGVKLKELLLSKEFMDSGRVLFNIVERSSPQIIEMLIRGELSVGWIIDINRPSSLKFIALERQEAYCVLNREHRLAQRERLAFAELNGENFMFGRTNNVAMVRLIEQRLREEGVYPGSRMNMKQHPNIQILSDWIWKGAGISFMPEHMARLMTEFVAIPMDPPLCFDVGLAWNPDYALTARCRYMIRTIKERYSEFVKS